MTTLALELNDVGLVALADGGPAAVEPLTSPGIAVVEGKTILTGVEAADVARLKPRRVHTRFWSRVDGGPLGRPFPADLTHADLAHEHLAGLWRRIGAGVERVILAVPGVYGEHQLGLLLGIAEAAGVPVEGLVDAALAAAASDDFGRQMIHVDLRLHDAVLTELTRDDELVRGRVQASDQIGLMAMRDIWAKHLARLLVRRTRFDPLHAATTEQALYRELEPLLDRLRRDDRSMFEIGVGHHVHGVEVTRGEIADAIGEIRDGLTDLVRRIRTAGEATTILLSHRAAGVPGLREGLASIAEAEVVELARTAAVAGALELRECLCAPGDGLPYVTRLPLGANDRPASRERASPSPPATRETNERTMVRPTHLLLHGRAYAISDSPLWVGVGVVEGPGAIRLHGAAAGVSRKHCLVVRAGDEVRVEDHSTYGTFLNGRRVEREARLAVGDRLQIGTPGVELALIRVIDREETPPD